MLSNEVLEIVSKRITSRIEDANTSILKQIGSHFDEIGKLGYGDAHKLAQMLKYGGDYDKIVNELAKATNLTNKDIEDLFIELAKQYSEFAKPFYQYRKIKYVPFDENEALKQQVNAITKLVQKNIKALMEPKLLGYGVIDTGTGSVTFKGLKDTFYNLIDEAIFSVSQGKETYDAAIARQIKQMGGGGLKVIYDSTYTNKKGIKVHRTRRLDSAVQMVLSDGLRELHNQTQEDFGKKFNANGVEVSVHSFPAPDHAEMQGRQFSKEEFDKLQTEGIAKDYKDREIDIHGTLKDGSHTEGFRPVSQYNCYHKAFSIILGVNSPEYTDEQLQKIIDENNEGFEIDGKHYTKYEGTQMQRRLETEIRKQKDIQIMAKEAGQDDLVRESQQKITELTNKYKELSDKAGIPTMMERMKVSGYRRKKVNINAKPTINYTDYKSDNDKIYKDFYDEYENKYNNLTDEQKEGLKKWSSYHYKDMQRNILGLPLEEDTPENTSKWIKEVDSILDNNEIGKDVVLFRGTSSKHYIDTNIGDTIEDNLFKGTSLNERIAHRFCEMSENLNDKKAVVLKIYAPKTTKGFYVGDYTTGIGEQEILLSRKTKYKVIDKTKVKYLYDEEKELEEIILEVIE